NVWGPWGPNPVRIVAHNLTGPIPFTSTFTISVHNFTGNYSVNWDTVPFGQPGAGNGTTLIRTFWEPGANETLGACVSNSTVGLWGCGTSNPFNVTGASALQVGAEPMNGTSP